jgi:probable H4MPT-linked C1 transfer pathway protein
VEQTLRSWIAFDIGGANIKAAHSSGPTRTLPFELWKRLDDLGPVLTTLAGAFPAGGQVAVTMTAELCDCYPTRRVGVLEVLAALSGALPDRPIHVWGTDGEFHTLEEVRATPLIAAAANWLALAQVAARLVPTGPGILIDIGTTTTDLIALCDGRAVARGRTDTERLQTGELVYAGMRRTPLCALATELPHRGQPTGLAAELFASTLDIYLTLSEIAPDPKDRSTADGRPATVEAARDRLARMVGTDRDEFSSADATALARAADECLLGRLTAAAERACRAVIARPQIAVVAGSGQFLARRLARRLIEPEGQIVGLSEAWGDVASTAACAHALLILAREAFDGGQDSSR